MQQHELKGLGGWLIVVGIGVTLSPFILLYQVLPLYYEIFSNGSFAALTTEGSEAYHALWAPVLMSEVVYNACIVVAGFYLMYLFYTKHYLFPRLYIIIVVSMLVAIPVNSWLVTLVLEDSKMLDAETIKEWGRTAISALIWIPYMLISERVKATFVEGRNPSLEVAGSSQ
tara:strand:- start:369 stop:881 length:513 start_codon:yes stop_codon:yes gene_type:complete